jgi:hypothetical protein
MPFLVGIGAAIWGAISAAASAVAAAAAAIGAAIGSAISAVTGMVAGIAAGVVSSVSAALASDILIYTAAVTAIDIETFWASAWMGTWLVESIGGIITAFTSVLDAIHFRTLMQIHQIAYTVSEDYRQMMESVWKEISNVSQALGFDAHFMNLCLRNTRNLVLDASALMGRGYDLGEVTWLQEMDRFFKDFSTKVERYPNRPDLFLADLDAMITKPTVDNLSTSMQNWILSLDATMQTTRVVVEGLDKVKTDIGKLVSDLPESVRKEIKPVIDPILKTWSDAVDTYYKPIVAGLDKVTKDIKVEQSVAKAAADKLVDRMKRPGKYLGEMTYLSPAEEAEDRAILQDLSYGDWRDEVGDFEVVIDDKVTDIEEIREKNLQPIPVVQATPSAMPQKVERVKPVIEPKKGWFVGDY